MVAAAGCAVAFGVAQQPQGAAAGTPGASALRRARQLAARHADAGRLQAALHRVEELEVELQNLQSAVRAMRLQAVEQAAAVLPTEKAPSPPPEANPGERLALMAPVLTNSRADSSTVRRRNEAGQCWGAPPRAIRRMGKASLNRLQRSEGGSGTEARQRPARQASARRRFDLAQRARLAEVAVQRMELPPSGSLGELPKKVAMKVTTVVLNTAALVLSWLWSMLEPPTTTTSMMVAVVPCTVAQVPRLAAANITMLLGTLVEFLVFFWQGLALQIAALARGDGFPDPFDERRVTGGRRRLLVIQSHFFQTVGTERLGGKPSEVWIQERESEHQAPDRVLRAAEKLKPAAAVPAPPRGRWGHGAPGGGKYSKGPSKEEIEEAAIQKHKEQIAARAKDRLRTAKMGERDTREDISKVFRLFDDDRTGTITATGTC
ncbi:unnamed protein product [Prorocentrum cordatum]|uniref:EF-hand domain-containing protein n=1 Tax=Prorocentrum cordatum TaxID=2364126 RepID=A0ABN9U5M1_9DINO|nr:unnamed protein product [Polarella glacialis]